MSVNRHFLESVLSQLLKCFTSKSHASPPVTEAYDTGFHHLKEQKMGIHCLMVVSIRDACSGVVAMRWHVPAPGGSKPGTATPGRSSPAWQGVCFNSVPPCSNLSQLSSLSALHQWGPAVKMRSCWSCCHSSKVSMVALGAEPVPAEHLPTDWLLQLYWTAMAVPHRNRKLQETSVGSDCPHQLPLIIRNWRLKSCSCGSAEARDKCRLLCDD